MMEVLQSVGCQNGTALRSTPQVWPQVRVAIHASIPLPKCILDATTCGTPCTTRKKEEVRTEEWRATTLLVISLTLTNWLCLCIQAPQSLLCCLT